MSKPPPLLSRGLIRPDRTLEQLRRGLPASSPRTPTPWERDYLLRTRKARIAWWIRACCIVTVFGWLISRFSPFRIFVLIGFGIWVLRCLYKLIPWVDTEVDGFWDSWETGEDARMEAWEGVTTWFTWGVRILLSLVVIPLVILYYVGRWLSGRALVRPQGTPFDWWVRFWTGIENVPVAVPDMPTRSSPTRREDEFVVTRYSRDDVGPRALRTLRIAFLPGQTPYSIMVLNRLGREERGSVEARTQYYRRRRKGLVSQEERDVYNVDDGDDKDDEDEDQLPAIPALERYIPPPGTLETKLYRRFTSLSALHAMKLPYTLWDQEYVIVPRALSFEDVQEVYRVSQLIRRQREGLGPSMEDEDDGYDLGQTVGGSDSHTEYSGDDSDDDEIPVPPRRSFPYAAGPGSIRNDHRSRSRTSADAGSGQDADTPLPPRRSYPYSRTSNGAKENVRSVSSPKDYPFRVPERIRRPYSRTRSSSRMRYAYRFNDGKEYLDEAHGFVEERQSRPYSRTTTGQREDLRRPKARSSTPASDRLPRQSSQQSREQEDYIRSTRSRQGQGSAPPRRRNHQSSKRNWFVPKWGGEIAKPIYSCIPCSETGARPERESSEHPAVRDRDRDTGYSGGQQQDFNTPPPQPRQETRNDDPKPATNKGSSTKPTTSTSGPGTDIARPKPIHIRTPPPRTPMPSPSPSPTPSPVVPNSTTPSPPTVPDPKPPTRLTIPVSTSPPPPEVPTSTPPPAVPMAAPRASSQLLRSLALYVTDVRTDCIGLWTVYQALFDSGMPIDIRLESQMLLQKVTALRNLFQTTFVVQPRLSMSSYQYKLESMEPELDDTLGLLQLFRQTLDAENPACPVLDQVRRSVRGLLHGVAGMLEKPYRELDEIVSDERRRRLRLLIPSFAIQDEVRARLDREQRVQEKEAREKTAIEKAAKDKAAIEKAAKDKADQDRIKQEAEIKKQKTDRESGRGKVPGTTNIPSGGSTKGPNGETNGVTTGGTNGGPTGGSPSQITGPTRFKAALRTRLRQGFLPTQTSAAEYLCGLRAVIISLENMNKLQPGSVRAEDLLAKMFIDPEIDPNFDFATNPDGQRGHPTEEYQAFLEDVLSQWGDSFTREADWMCLTSKQNFASIQLLCMLQLLDFFGFMESGDQLSLGIVTAGRRDPATPASIQIMSRTEAINHANVVWVYNDNRAMISGGENFSHWSGFAPNADDRRHWLGIVQGWGLEDHTQDRSADQSGTGNSNPGNNNSGGPAQPNQGGAGEGLAPLERLRSLAAYLDDLTAVFEQIKVRPVIHFDQMEAIILDMNLNVLPNVLDTPAKELSVFRVLMALRRRCLAFIDDVTQFRNSRSEHRPEGDMVGGHGVAGGGFDTGFQSGLFGNFNHGNHSMNHSESDAPPGARRENVADSGGRGGRDRGRGDRGPGDRGRGGHGRGDSYNERSRSEEPSRQESPNHNGNRERGGGRGGGDRGGRDISRGGGNGRYSRSEERPAHNGFDDAGSGGQGHGRGGGQGTNSNRGGNRGGGGSSRGRGNWNSGSDQEARGGSDGRAGNNSNGKHGRGGANRGFSNEDGFDGGQGSNSRGGARGGRGAGRGDSGSNRQSWRRRGQ